MISIRKTMSPVALLPTPRAGCLLDFDPKRDPRKTSHTATHPGPATEGEVHIMRCSIDTRYKGRTHVQRRQDPLKYASDIMAVWIIRDPDTSPGEPLRVRLDRSFL